jgi:hypothetical protein
MQSNTLLYYRGSCAEPLLASQPTYEDPEESFSRAERLRKLVIEARIGRRQEVFFDEDCVDEVCIIELLYFDHLQSLILPNGKFPVEHIVYFNLKKLVVREFVDFPSDDEKPSQSALRKLQSVAYLSILGPINIRRVFAFLHNEWFNLQYLSIHGEITADRLRALFNLIFVRTLVVESANSVQLRWFAAARRPIELVLKAPISFADYKPKAYDNITSLRLYDCTGITNFDFIEYCRTGLTTVALRNSPKISVSSLNCVLELIYLRHLDLSGTPVLNDELLRQIVRRKLALVTLLLVRDTYKSHDKGFTSEGVIDFLAYKQNTELQRLDLSGHGLITVDSLSHEMYCLRKLSWLGLRKTGCYSFVCALDIGNKRQRLLKSSNSSQHVQRLPKLTILITASDPQAKANTQQFGTDNNSIEVQVNTADCQPTYGCHKFDANSLNDF